MAQAAADTALRRPAPPSSPSSRQANLHPLWDRYKRITPIKPQPKDTPFLWRWRDTEPFLHRAVARSLDRRHRAARADHGASGLRRRNPDHQHHARRLHRARSGRPARPHRHTGAAIRFATRADGAATIVNGRRCDMKDGDLILTPPMCWHGHINPERPPHRLVRRRQHAAASARLDAHFFEPGDPHSNEFWQVDEGDEKRWRRVRARGRRTRRPRARSIRRNIAIPGEATRRLLAAIAARPRRRAADPLHQSGNRRRGDADARLLRHAADARTRRPARSAATYNDDLPRGRPARAARPSATRPSNGRSTTSSPSRTGPGRSHRAIGGDADLFIVSDKSAFERLDVLREELQ